MPGSQTDVAVLLTNLSIVQRVLPLLAFDMPNAAAAVQESVQQQLEALCELSPLCAPAHLKQQKGTNKQLQAEISALRSKLRHSQTQLRHSEAQLRRSEAQLRRSEAQVQLLQQQLEAAQAAGQKD
jgi:septal ring factor EnvC (AmiA/AmiB activator)